MRKTQLKSVLLGSTLLLSGVAAIAAPDYERIHKDVTVMSNIIKGAFESDANCRGCGARIEANYLANQGAVFTVSASTWRSFNLSDGHPNSYSFVIPSPDEVEHIEITEVVSEVLDNVGAVMEDVGERIEVRLGDFEYDEMVMRQDSETRRILRDINRERRELEYRRRENEIELIHADEPTRKRVEKRIKELEDKIARVEEKQAKVSKTFEKEREERERQRQVKVKKAKLEAEQQQTAIENIVLQSLCDYGATLKNIPDSEHVSVLFEQRKESKADVMVMDMKDIKGCSNPDILRGDAISYQF